MQSLSDSLSTQLSASFASDNDPELIRQAVPFSLKLIESLMAENPHDDGLLYSAAKGFTQYAYAFLQQDADEIEDRDSVQASALRQRAAKLYLRARDYGMQALEQHHWNRRRTAEALRISYRSLMYKMKSCDIRNGIEVRRSMAQ